MREPETYYFTPTQYVPNSDLPVLIYRDVLTSSPSLETATRILEGNQWMKGGVFKHYPTHHFHSVTHECYAAINGSSRLLLGRGPLDDQEGGIEVEMKKGDIIVLPAGVCHCNLESHDDYTYVGVYPKGSPHWDNNWCKAERKETEQKADTAKSIPIPAYDPIYGEDGPLCKLWKRVRAE